MRLVLDMHISVEVAYQLRADGHEVFQLRERQLQKLEDEQIVALAVIEDRVVVTFDLDFSAILAASGDSHPSIVQFRIGKTDAALVLRWLRQIISAYALQLGEGCILTVAEDRIRIRKLPLV